MNKVSYSKPWLSIEDQLRKLEGRGLVVADRSRVLRRIGRRTLSGGSSSVHLCALSSLAYK